MFRALGLFVVCCMAAGAQSLGNIEKKAEEVWSKIEAFTGDVTLEASLPISAQPAQVLGAGTLEYLRDEGVEKYRQRITIEVPPALGNEAAFEALFDGETLHLTNELLGQRREATSRYDVMRGILPPGGKNLIKILRERLDLKVLPEETLDDSPVYVIEGFAKAAQGIPFHKVRVFIDQGAGLWRKIEVYETETLLVTTVRCTNINLKPEINPAIFVYIEPEPAEPLALDSEVPEAQSEAASENP